MKIAATRWITALIILGLLGVLTIQAIWIKRAVDINARAMDQAVSQALASTSNKLESIEDAMVIQKHLPDSVRRIHEFKLKNVEYQEIEAGRRPLRIIKSISSSEIDSNLKQRVNIKIDSLKTRVGAIAVESSFPDSVEYSDEIMITTIDSNSKVLEERLFQIELKQERIGKLIDEMAYTMSIGPMSWKEHLSDSTLKYLLTEEFSLRGLPLDFEFAVWPPVDTAKAVIKTAGFDKLNSGKIYTSPLLTESLVNEPPILEIAFPGRNSHILRTMLPLILLSMVFAILLIAAASASILTMFRQKKLNRMKSDFINNISHEFKTPIASIGLASDSIENEKVVNNPIAIRNYVRIIREENKRMQDQVEKVLQMALIDRHELDFNMSVMELKPLAARAVQSMKIQAESKGGKLNFLSEADEVFAKIDQVHLFNALTNLIDNAIKYSEDAPDVRVELQVQDQHVQICVRDRGIGMDKATQQKVFDRFYRYDMGNVHNVKGFGLGLSYVREVVQAMDGSITIESKKGVGSTFTLALPQTTNESNHGKA